MRKRHIKVLKQTHERAAHREQAVAILGGRVGQLLRGLRRHYFTAHRITVCRFWGRRCTRGPRRPQQSSRLSSTVSKVLLYCVSISLKCMLCKGLTIRECIARVHNTARALCQRGRRRLDVRGSRARPRWTSRLLLSKLRTVSQSLQRLCRISLLVYVFNVKCLFAPRRILLRSSASSSTQRELASSRASENTLSIAHMSSQSPSSCAPICSSITFPVPMYRGCVNDET